MLVNEGLPAYLASQLKQRGDLSKMRVGILGMAFKGDSDDKRDSLSYKLKKLLEIEAAQVYCHDPFIKDKRFLASATDLIKKSNIVIVGAPHSQYKKLKISGKKVVDIWNIFGKGATI